MILNTRIWNETVNAAKLAASDSPAWLRAIERAVIEIERSKYWSFDGDVLTIISTTSKKTYRFERQVAECRTLPKPLPRTSRPPSAWR